MKRSGFVLLWLSLSAVSCRGCGADKPYTPFAVQSALPGADAGPAVPAPSASAPASLAGQKALVAPPGSRRWLLGLRELVAPDGLVFSLAVPGKAPGDFVVWLVRDGAGAGPEGGLWLFPAGAAARRLSTLPGFIPTGPDCTLDATLARTGATSVTLDLAARCERTLIARSPLRALLVLGLDSERPLLELRLAAPAPDEVLELVSATADRDQDGRDDVTLGVRVGLASGPRAEAPLVLFDRTAGTARDGAEPRRTLERLAAREASRAKTKKVAEDVLASVGAIRRLMATLCAEGATPRVFDGDGAPYPCGSLATVADSLLSAELDATLALGRVREAFGVLERDGWYYAAAGAATRKRLEKAVLDAIEPVSARVTAVAMAPAVTLGPHFSPLWFDAQGNLYVRASDGIHPIGANGAVAPAAPIQSPDPLVRAGGRVLSTAVYSCDRSETTLMFDTAPPSVTRLLAPRPGACGRASFDARVRLNPVSAGASVSALLGATLIGDEAPGSRSPPGSARSPDGRTIAVWTAYGLLLDGAKHRLLDLGSSMRDAKLTDFVPANGGTRAACVQGDRALLIEGGS